MEIGRLVLMVAAVIVVGYLAGYGETVLILLFLILCIVAHEFGHFVAAKTGKVKVTEFFVGFGPRLWSVRRGETEYGIKALPLGGYCRIIGMTEMDEIDPADVDRTYRAASLPRRLLIDVAGSAMHFLIAIVLLFVMFFWTGTNAGDYLSKIPPDSPVVAIIAIQNGQSPAEKSGFEIGDRIETIDGVRFASWVDQSKFIQAHAGVRLDVTVDRSGRIIHLYPTPIAADSVKAVGGQELPAGKVGFIGLDTSGVIHSSFSASLGDAGGAFWSDTTNTASALVHLVTLHGFSSYFNSLTSQQAATSNSQQLVTVVALPSVLHQAGESGLPTVLWVVALINLSIGILNLLPLFPLDGFRVAVSVFEAVVGLRRRGYRISYQRVLPAATVIAGLLFLYSLGWVLINIRTMS
jgi:membrane-associated protease RseP (regulator of RpoE activity)